MLPHMKGKLHGLALRVPVSNVSMVDLVVDLKKMSQQKKSMQPSQMHQKLLFPVF